MRILVVEDEQMLARFLTTGLEGHHYDVEVAGDGPEARSKAEAGEHDLIILDLKIPGVQGHELLHELRTMKPATPILILSGMSDTQDRVKGLELGADDYLTKPFAFAELLVRMRNLIRRTAEPVETVLRMDDLELNRIERTVMRAGKRIDLSPKEFGLLEYLLRHAGQRVSRSTLMESVWGFSPGTLTNVVDVYISYLRKKVDEGFERKLIHTVRGAGYEIGIRENARAAGAASSAVHHEDRGSSS